MVRAGGRQGLRVSSSTRLVTDTYSRLSSWNKYLRADASPNWSQRVKEREGDAVTIASKPAITVTHTSSILDAIEAMTVKRVRGLIVVDSSKRLRGTLTATDVIDYLGGRARSIVERRHGGDLYSALRREQVESIMNAAPLYATVTSRIAEVLRMMVLNGVGFIPIVDKDNVPIGVITEHDMVRHFSSGSEVRMKVSTIMTTNMVAAYSDDTLKRAAELMSIYGFRRLPVISREEGMIIGVLSAIDFISFFGTHEALSRASSYDLDSVLNTKVSEVMSKDVNTIRQDADVAEAVSLMNKYNTNSLIVINESNEAVGLITERDVLLALATQVR